MIGTVVASLILLYVFGLGGTDSPPSTTKPANPVPDNMIGEVAARPFWTAAPHTYDSAASQPSDGASNDLYDGTVSGGDVVAVTPRDLVERASLFAGRTVYLVGKVTSQEDINTKHGLTTEFEIHGTDPGYVAYMAQDGERIERAPNGAVVYALGRLAASGEGTGGQRGRVKAVYFLCLHFCDFESVHGLSPAGSDAIRRAARGLHPSTTSDFIDTTSP